MSEGVEVILEILRRSQEEAIVAEIRRIESQFELSDFIDPDKEEA
jgi:hypothetical protein